MLEKGLELQEAINPFTLDIYVEIISIGVYNLIDFDGRKAPINSSNIPKIFLRLVTIQEHKTVNDYIGDIIARLIYYLILAVNENEVINLNNRNLNEVIADTFNFKDFFQEITDNEQLQKLVNKIETETFNLIIINHFNYGNQHLKYFLKYFYLGDNYKVELQSNKDQKDYDNYIISNNKGFDSLDILSQVEKYLVSFKKAFPANEKTFHFIDLVYNVIVQIIIFV